MKEANVAAGRALVVLNPAAGRRRGRLLDAALAELGARGWSLRVIETRRRGDAEALARAAAAGGCDMLVGAGGDGTINEMVNGLMAAPAPVPPLAVLPLGTANVLAREIGLATEGRAAAAIAGGRRRAIAVGVAGGRHFIMMAGAGFDAHVVATLDPAAKRRFGRLAYIAAALRESLRYPFPPLTVTTDGARHVAGSVVACNGRHYGGPYVAAPAASLDDESFQVLLLTKGGAAAVLRYGAALAGGGIARRADVCVVTAREVVIEGPEGLPLQADGDIVAHLPVRLTLAPRRLDLVVP